MEKNRLLIIPAGVGLIILFFMGLAFAWEYPVIKGYGPVQSLPEAAVQPDKHLKYKVLFDITHAAKEVGKVNPGLDHVARFINVMASGGIRPEKMSLVAVVHGDATPIILKNDIFKEKLGQDNPNIKLVNELRKAGVKLYVCGQALADDNFKSEWVNPEIVLSLSALVDVPTFQLKGYAYLAF